MQKFLKGMSFHEKVIFWSSIISVSTILLTIAIVVIIRTIEDRITVVETVQIWGSIISAIVVLTTIAQVAATYLIADSVKVHSTRLESANASRHINLQWQEFNRLVITDQQFRLTLRKMENLTEEDDRIRMKYMMFIILNILHDAFYAQLALGIKSEHIEENITDQLLLYKHQSELILSILDGNRGYDEKFIRHCKNILES